MVCGNHDVRSLIGAIGISSPTKVCLFFFWSIDESINACLFAKQRTVDICRWLRDIGRYLPISVDICRYLPISADTADICRYLGGRWPHSPSLSTVMVSSALVDWGVAGGVGVRGGGGGGEAAWGALATPPVGCGGGFVSTSS